MESNVGKLITSLCDMVGQSRSEKVRTALLGAIGALAEGIEEPLRAAVRQVRPTRVRQKATAPSPAPAASGKATGRRRISPQRRAALRLQGKLLAMLRQLSARQRAAIKALRNSKGLQEALKLAESMMKARAK